MSFAWLRVRPGITSLLASALVLVAAALAACGDGTETASPTDTQQPTETPSSSATINAVTSLEIFADMVRNVGGDRVAVEGLLPSGADPHTFELSPGKAADIARADVIFINGLDLEHSIEDIIDNTASGPVIELAAGLPVLEDGNPHLWLDPRMGAEYAEHIRDALIDVDPAGRAGYEANTTAYLEQLGELDMEYAAAIEAIPQERRKLVTFHDAYPYLAARYALEVVGVVVPSPGQEPSARDLAGLIDAIESQLVPAVFKEPQFNSEVLDQAASSAGVQVLDLLSDAYADGVDSYIGLMRFNLQQLEAGLGGD